MVVKKTVHRTVRLDIEQVARLEAIATEKKRNFSELLCIVVAEWLERRDVPSASKLPHARISEYAGCARYDHPRTASRVSRPDCGRDRP